MRGAVLFLDFDGVLHSTIAPDNELFSLMPLLESWLRRRPEVAVVVSSSWRHSHTLEELRHLFSEDVRNQVIGVTDTYWKRIYEETGEVPLTAQHERLREVEHWLATNMPGAPWAALDDLPEQFGRLKERVAACEPRRGLTEQCLNNLDEILEQQVLAAASHSVGRAS